MRLTPEQELAVRAPGSVAVTAGAGTGKTHLLTQRYLHHLAQQHWSPLQIVAVTFTEKAAAELRARIRAAVAAQPDPPAEVLAELEAAQISTIHSLAARICRDHYELAKIPADFKVLDEEQGAIWRAEHFPAALESIPLEIFRAIPFSKLSQAMRTFLDDPHAAAAALELGLNDWTRLVEVARAAEWERVRDHSAWRSAGGSLSSAEGSPGDKLEPHRAAALAAWRAMESGDVSATHFDAICGVKLNVGAQRNWPDGSLDAIKACLKQLRELAKSSRPLALLDLCAADHRAAELLPLLKDAFDIVREFLDGAKKRSRVLDFNDLELSALKILKHDSAREYYAQRWRAFLVDEFQDTNPVQGELLEHLTGNAVLTIVGDEQQGIYGFRRADVEVFRGYRQRIVAGGGEERKLSVTYRAHEELAETINRIFAPVLGELHRPLSAQRKAAPQTGPHIAALVVRSDEKMAKSARQRVEAVRIAGEVRRWLDTGRLVHDKTKETLRAIEPRDIAVLSRVKSVLDYYGDAFAAMNIPAVNAGGGDLLGQREVMDAIALLNFLADTGDDLALVAVLRSPYFALSDRTLYQFANGFEGKFTWWTALQSSPPREFAGALAVLQELLGARAATSPRGLLQRADELTGYGAVIANLPNAARREADRQCFLDLLSQWERGGFDQVFTVVRQLRTMAGAEIQVTQPPLEIGDAVTLMSIHAAKGLEWPTVIVPDLARQAQSDTRKIRLDPKIGVAFAADGEDEQKSAVLTLIDERRKQAEADEARRVLYVALTRARDQILLTATAEKGPALDVLGPGLEAAGIPLDSIDFVDADAMPPELGEPPALGQPEAIRLDAVPRTVTEVRITDLHEYSVCPRRFHYHAVLGFPDPTREEPDAAAAEGDQTSVEALAASSSAATDATGNGPELPLFAGKVDPATAASGFANKDVSRRIGNLTHRALELGITDAAALALYDATLSPQQVAEALTLAERFRHAPAFTQFQGNGPYRREWPVVINVNRIRLIGTVDLAGPDFVLDYKTGRLVDRAEYRFQLWAYARAAGVATAYLADLRAGELHTYDAGELALIEAEAVSLLERISRADFTATPSKSVCGDCPYGGLCPYSLA